MQDHELIGDDLIPKALIHPDVMVNCRCIVQILHVMEIDLQSVGFLFPPPQNQDISLIDDFEVLIQGALIAHLGQHLPHALISGGLNWMFILLKC